LSTTLALNTPVVTSSNETANGNIAAHATDGDVGTKWCASDGSFPQWAILDLGATAHTLTSISILWENGAADYQYKVEVSNTATAATDPAGASWTVAADQTTNVTTYNAGHHSDALSASGRFVRLTVTNIPTQYTWACAYEVSISGY
jgi:hypothetical protein